MSMPERRKLVMPVADDVRTVPDVPGVPVAVVPLVPTPPGEPIPAVVPVVPPVVMFDSVRGLEVDPAPLTHPIIVTV
jgi:hypothetical protein